MKICRPYITLRNGQRLYAYQKGLKAFCFEVTSEQQKNYQEKKSQNDSSDNKTELK